jgi:hypothetical protein
MRSRVHSSRVTTARQTLSAILLCVMTMGSAYAQRVEFDVAGEWPGHRRGAGPHAVAVSGDYAYLVSGRGFDVFEVSEAADPRHVGAYVGFVSRIAVSGNYAYAAAGLSGLHVIDIANPAVPTLVASAKTTNAANSIALSGGHAYMAVGNGLEVIDISDPLNPVRIGGINAGGPRTAIAIAGSRAFLAGSSPSLQVIDVADAANPAVVGTYNTNYTVQDVAVSGNHVFLLNRTVLDVIDVGEPTDPQRVGGFSWNVEGDYKSVTVSGGFAYVTRQYDRWNWHYPPRWGGLTVLNISDPANPTWVRSWNNTADSLGVVLSGTRAFLANAPSEHNPEDCGLEILSLAGSDTISQIAHYSTCANSKAVAVGDNRAYVADSAGGFATLDVSDAANPRRVKVEKAIVSHVVTLSNHVYTLSSTASLEPSGWRTFGTLSITDVSNPTNPVPKAYHGVAGEPTALAVFGNHAFVGVYANGLHITDIANPAAPVIVGTYSNQARIADVAVAGDYAYLVNQGGTNLGLEVLDISNRASPIRVGGYNTWYLYGVAVSGDYVFMVNSGQFVVLDVSIPSSPVLVSETGEGGSAVVVSGTHAFVSGYPGVHVFDISNPTAPVRVGTYQTRGNPQHVAVHQNYIYVADGDWGVQVLAIQPRLFAHLSDNQLFLEWSSVSHGFALESTPALVPTQWQPSIEPPDLQNGVYRIAVPLSDTRRFFRLQKP